MSNSRECPSAEQLQLLALGQLPEPIVQDIEQHVLDCQSCAQMTLNLVADETLIETLRGARTGEKSGRSEPSSAEKLFAGDAASLPELVNHLIRKLRDLPIREFENADHETVLSDDVDFGTCSEIDWSSCFAPGETSEEIGRLNGFRVLKLLGVGGMGGVFLAEDMQLGRQVALKIMHPMFASKAGATERFLREAQAVAAIRNEHIVTIFQVGQDGGVPFLTQELLHGETLHQRLRREKVLPIGEAILIAKQIAEGLAAAHERGLIHRDIKPANVWLEGAERRGKRQPCKQCGGTCPSALGLQPATSQAV